MDKDDLARMVASTLANHAAAALADTNINETPAYAELFGLETEAT